MPSMRLIIKQLATATKKVLKNSTYLYIFLGLTPIIAFLLFLIPVKTIPGNNLQLQIQQLYWTKDYLLLIPLALLESLLIVMFFYIIRSHHKADSLKTLGKGNVGMLSGVPAFIFGSKLCPMCVAAILGGFGPGAVLFAIQYRHWIFLTSAAILLLSIYSLSKKVNGACEECR